MKRVIIAFLIVFTSHQLFSQKKEEILTQAEQFSSQAGTLIERQFIEIGKVKGVEVKVLKYKDLNNGAERSALRFEYDYKSSYSTDTKITSLDTDEIEGLIKSIKNLQANVFTTTRLIYTEVTFRSRTGFEAGAYYSPEKSNWKAYIQIEKYDSDSTVFFSTEDFAELLSMIERAKELL